MRFTSVQLDGDFAGHTVIDLRINLQQAVNTEVRCEKYLRFIPLFGSRAICGLKSSGRCRTQSKGAAFQKRPTQHFFSHVFHSPSFHLEHKHTIVLSVVELGAKRAIIQALHAKLEWVLILTDCSLWKGACPLQPS